MRERLIPQTKSISSNHFRQLKAKGLNAGSLGEALFKLGFKRKKAKSVFVSMFMSEQGIAKAQAIINAEMCIKEQFDPHTKRQP